MLDDHRPLRPFQVADAGIAVEPDHQHVAQRRGLVQIRDVPDVQQVEATIGEDDFVSIPAVRFGQRDHLVDADQLAGSAAFRAGPLSSNLGAADRCDARFLHFQTRGHVGQIHCFGKGDSGSLAETDHGQDHVAGAGDVVDGVGFRGNQFAQLVSSGQCHAFAVECDQHRQ